MSADLADDDAFSRAFVAEVRRAGIHAAKTVWLSHGLAYRSIPSVPHERRQELLESLRMLPALQRRE